MKKAKIVIISSNGTIKILGSSACIAPKFFLTHANACTQRNHVNRSGEGFETISKKFQEIKTWAQIMCFCVMFPNQLLHIDEGEHESFDALSYHLMNKNTKHQKGKNKNAWQTTMSNGLMAIRTKGIYKAC